MIFDQLEHLEKYREVHPRFADAFAFLREMLEKDPAPGRYEMPNGRGHEIIVNVFDYQTKPMGSEVQMEAHRDYIDIQVVLEGEENMYVPNVRELPITVPYDIERDIEFFRMPTLEHTARATVCKGCFAVLFANELHAPGISLTDEPTSVRKFVVKVLN